MLWFLILAGVLTIAATAYLTRPLYQRGQKSVATVTGAPDPSDRPVDQQTLVSLEVHRQRLIELEAAVDAGEIEPDQASAERTDLERALVDDMAPYLVETDTRVVPGAPAGTRGARAWPSAIVCTVLVPLAAVGLYLQIGGLGLLNDASSASVLDGRLPKPSAAPTTPQEMVARLEARLATDPGQGEDWRLLGRSYLVLDRPADAVRAFERAHALLGERVEVLIEYAEAESVRDGYRFSASASARLERALALTPDHPKALMLAGLAALQAGNPGLATQRIRRVLVQYPPQSREADTIRDLATRAGLDLDTGAADPAPPASVGDNSVLGPAGSAAVSTAAGPVIRVEVQIDPALLATADARQIVQSSRLFVFARAPQGPRIPLAVRQFDSPQLPLTVELSDAHSMMPGRNLSSSDSVIIGARLSSTGSATAASGDLEGFSDPVSPGGSAAVTVRIDRRHP